MYRLKLAVWIFLTALINFVFADYIKIGAIRPDILFSFVLCYAIMHDKPVGIMSVAVISGALLDCFSGRIFGIYTSVFVVSAVVIYILRDFIYKEWFLVDVLFIFLISILGKSLVYFININIFKEAGYFYFLLSVVLPESVYNSVISCVMLPLMRKTFKRKVGTFI